MPEVVTRRVYDPVGPDDGFRVLVDRLWPRGVSRERAALDLWDKDVAPSPELRRAWSHDPGTFEGFAAAYRAELDASGAAGKLLAAVGDIPRLTLLYAARDRQVNHAVVLAAYLGGLLGS